MSYYGGKYSGEPYEPNAAAATNTAAPVLPQVAPIAASAVLGDPTRLRATIGPATGNGWYVRRITIQGEFG